MVGHLSNGDFFLVEEYPTATFAIKSMADGVITGDLTIRGNTKETKCKFDARHDFSNLIGNEVAVINCRI